MTPEINVDDLLKMIGELYVEKRVKDQMLAQLNAKVKELTPKEESKPE